MSVLPRSFIIFALCVPLALLLGVMLATPLNSSTMLFVGMAFLLLLTPFLLTNHHVVLILSWNAYINVFFLPGQPYLWLLMTAVSLFFSVLTRTLNREKIKFLWLPSVAIPMVVMGIVVLVTAQLTGGIGARALGSDVFGGRRYFYVLGALAGFFAITAKAIPLEKRQFVAAGFFLLAVSAIVSNIAYMLGPQFYWMFLLFPAEWVMGQVFGEQTLQAISRLSGLAPTTLAICAYLLLRHGIKGILDFSRPHRFIIFFISVGAGLFSGFRSHLLLVFLLVAIQFFVEGLYRTKYLPILALTSTLLLSAVLPFSEHLPLAAQRALTILPVEVDPVAKIDAQNSLDWRFDMWRVLIGEIPRYFWLGKGYAINPTDLYLTEESVKRGIYTAFDPAMISGDYHSGPFSLGITFGIFGVLTFLWILGAGLRVLWRNLKYGDPQILNINQFLLTFFLARFVYFVGIFGSFHVDLATFTGVIGLSIAINGGMRSRRDLMPVEIPAEQKPVRRRFREELEPVPV